MAPGSEISAFVASDSLCAWPGSVLDEPGVAVFVVSVQPQVVSATAKRATYSLVRMEVMSGQQGEQGCKFGECSRGIIYWKLRQTYVSKVLCPLAQGFVLLVGGSLSLCMGKLLTLFCGGIRRRFTIAIQDGAVVKVAERSVGIGVFREDAVWHSQRSV